jgi:hypothetical protein
MTWSRRRPVLRAPSSTDGRIRAACLYGSMKMHPPGHSSAASLTASSRTPAFSGGAKAVVEAITSGPTFSVVGGGDTVAALDQLGLTGQVTFVSTGGGASLELIERGDLPGLRALRGAPNAPGRRRVALEGRADGERLMI